MGFSAAASVAAAGASTTGAATTSSSLGGTAGASVEVPGAGLLDLAFFTKLSKKLCLRSVLGVTRGDSTLAASSSASLEASTADSAATGAAVVSTAEGSRLEFSVVGSGRTGGSAETTVSLGGTTGATSLSFFSLVGLRTLSKKAPNRLLRLLVLGLSSVFFFSSTGLEETLLTTGFSSAAAASTGFSSAATAAASTRAADSAAGTSSTLAGTSVLGSTADSTGFSSATLVSSTGASMTRAAIKISIVNRQYRYESTYQWPRPREGQRSQQRQAPRQPRWQACQLQRPSLRPCPPSSLPSRHRARPSCP